MSAEIHLALFQPDIAGNTGTILRTAACLGCHVHLIEPAGFDVSDRALKRAGMDYIEMAALKRHLDWDSFTAWRLEKGLALTLMTTKATKPYTQHDLSQPAVILFGSESSGVPAHVHQMADHRLTIPMREGARSLNLAVSVGIIAAEAIRQVHA